MKTTLGILVLALSTCGDDAPLPPLPLDAPLGQGQARAGKVTRTSELIGGPSAYGRVGQVWKLYNAKVRFLVQDVGVATSRAPASRSCR